MEKIEIVYVPTNKHIFFCDRCEKRILESVELDDGYYERPYVKFNEYDDVIKSFIGNDIILCEKCKDYYEKYYKNKFNEFTSEFKKVDKIIKGDC